MSAPKCGECGRRLMPWEIATCGRCLRATMRVIKAERKLARNDKDKKGKGKK